jgi:hypothetical protein
MSLAENSRESKLGAPEAAMPEWYSRFLDMAKSLSVFNDPRGQYAFCFCDIR